MTMYLSKLGPGVLSFEWLVAVRWSPRAETSSDALDTLVAQLPARNRRKD